MNDWHSYVVAGLAIIGSAFNFLLQRTLAGLDAQLGNLASEDEKQWERLNEHGRSLAVLEDWKRRLESRHR